MKVTLLRYVLMIDAAVLFLIGTLLIFLPRQVEIAFHFADLPAAVSYLIGLWGCVFVTIAGGYVIAATQPLKYLIWVQIGIARGSLECLLGVTYLARGIVTWQQAAFGLISAAVITGAYIALYPRSYPAARRAA